jgi:uncharacterized membrane protein YbaN (DUF454 family)
VSPIPIDALAEQADRRKNRQKRPRRHPAVRIARNVAAVLLLVLAIVGSLIPILQGWMFLVAAIAVADFERKRVFNRWLLTQTFLRRVGGYKLYRRLHHRPRRKKE